jgi:Uma2 family endonuclease
MGSSSSDVDKLSVWEYFELTETTAPMELVYGIVREPPAPRYGHQSIVTRLTRLLDAHVDERRLGRVCVSPVDVVLDQIDALVVQPDIVFVSQERLAIIGDRIWGPPDLVVEVLSPRTAARDRTTKVAWYRRYGVRECWLVDDRRRAIEVADLQSVGIARLFVGGHAMRSCVLPEWTLPAEQLFS